MFRYLAAASGFFLVFVVAVWIATDSSFSSCTTMLERGLAPIAKDSTERFLGKVQEDTARCRGGDLAAGYRQTPWVDWANYWSAGDDNSRASTYNPISLIGQLFSRNGRGLDGALMDLERQRIELIKFSMFDNYTYPEYDQGRNGQNGQTLRVWPQMRVKSDNKDYAAVGGSGAQICRADLIRFRTVNGICNDMRNPAMGSTGTAFARNVQFEATFPILAAEAGDTLVLNRHGNRIGMLQPDPQVISRMLLARQQSAPEACNAGLGLPDNDAAAQCDYKKAPSMNVLAAYWVQFMTHDWFSHLEEGENDTSHTIPMGCVERLANAKPRPLSPEDVQKLGCNPDMREYPVIVQDIGLPLKFDGNTRLARARKTSPNTVTAWWDASQIYGYDDRSRARVKRDPQDPAKLMLRPVDVRKDHGDTAGYLPILRLDCPVDEPGCKPDPMNPKWNGQEATAFPENWSIGMSFFHNLFAREHNTFVTAFREEARRHPSRDSGLRRPQEPDTPVLYQDMSDDEIFEIARLVIAAQIAKIHTIEWTTQLLYDEPLRVAMNSNWEGLFVDHPQMKRILSELVTEFGKSGDDEKETTWYSVFSSGAGIVGTGTLDKNGDVAEVDYDNAGTNHFGVPFNFTEEFVSVYRLHAMLPDLIELRNHEGNPNAIIGKLPVVSTFRSKATGAMHEIGLEDIALSLGRQRLGRLALQNHPQFLQNLTIPSRPEGPTKTIDVVALDILRDRERGVPKFNEFRRQIGLRQLTSFSDFVDVHLARKKNRTAVETAELIDQRHLVELLRRVYGQHVCDASKIISSVQLSPDLASGGSGQSPFPNDCLGQKSGSLVDNVEDLDTVVGYLAETTRPHGFAISETQFQIFIVNASRRLFSDRFFTSSYRPEFYSRFGLDWVNNNGPDKQFERGRVNGHRQQVLPLKRVLIRNLPGLGEELEHVINAFDPWARDRGDYYATDWVPQRRAADDPAFSNTAP